MSREDMRVQVSMYSFKVTYRAQGSLSEVLMVQDWQVHGE